MAEDTDPLRWLIGDPFVVRAVFEDITSCLISLEGPEYTIVAVNAAYRALVGHADLVGRSVRDVLPEIAGQRIFDLLDDVYRTGRRVHASEWHVQVVREDTGELADLYLDFVLSPRRGADGTVIGTLAEITDATERVRARQDLRAQAEREQRRFEATRNAIAALQREVLPTGPPVVPEVRMAASYLFAGAGDAAGGDWFDAAALPDGRVALVVGDAVGHGVSAAIAMGQLQAVLRDRLLELGELAPALAALERTVARVRATRSATVCAVLLDPSTGELQYCTAGHPPPLIVQVDGQPRYLPVSGASPLGHGSRFPVAHDRLEPGDVLLLYTDGIIELPAREPGQGSVQFAQVATDVIAGRAFLDEGLPVVDQVCTQTVELLVRPGGHADDITLLAVQRRPAPTAFHVHRPAEQGAPVTVRRGLHRWLAEIGASGEDQFALQHVVNELVANAVQHAYVNGSSDAGAARTIDVHGSLSVHGEVHLTVSDHGRWRARSEDPYRGRGLALSSRLVDELLIDRRTDGTTVTVRHRLTGAAHLLNAERVTSNAHEPSGPDASMLLVLDQPLPPAAQPDDPSPRARIRLDGSIDLTTVEPLEQELLRRTTSGTHSITVDLTGVTHLASSGVAALYRLADRAERNGSELCLYAPVGSTAQQILSLVQLGHVTTDPDWPEPPP